MSKVIIRRLKEGDEQEDFEFLKTVFGGWHSLRQWQWKYREIEKAEGRKSIIWVMEAEGKIVGHVGAIPMKLRIDSDLLPVCQLVDVGSNPHYRHKGLYNDLFNRILDDAVEKGFAAAFGFANIRGYRTCERQGSFHTICQITKMFKILSLSNALNTLQIRLFSDDSERNGDNSALGELLVTQKGKVLSIILDLTRKTLSSILTSFREHEKSVDDTKLKKIDPRKLDSELHGSWLDFSPRYKVSFERDPQFLHWRYGNPEAKYDAFVAKNGNSTAGYVVVGVEEKTFSLGRLKLGGLREGYIVDLVAEKNFVIPLLLAAENELKKQGACLAECWSSGENSSFFKALRAIRFCQLPNELYRVFFVAKIDSPQLKTSLATECNDDLLISLGDSDIV